MEIQWDAELQGAYYRAVIKDWQHRTVTGQYMFVGFFDQPVTFRKTDSIIFFDTFWSRDSWELNTWDISFRFKTTAENGVMVHRSGEEDFIEIKIVSK